MRPSLQPETPDTLASVLKGSRTDRLLLIAVLAGIIIAWSGIRQVIAAGAPPMAYIYHGETLLATYPIPDDAQVKHFSAQGDLGISEISISRDGARITDSPCTTHQCMLSGSHRHVGDIIACVPNRILVSIRGVTAGGGKLDAIVE